MSSIKQSINETIAKLKSLISEGDVTPTPELSAMDKRRMVGSVDPTSAVSLATSSANNYGDRLDTTSKLKANEIVKGTLMKGHNGAVSAEFIDDLDARWDNKKRISLDTPKTIAYDYIIQNLAAAYQTPDGSSIDVGGQPITITSSMKKNAYEGLLKMFDLEDAAGRWKWFIFGSNIPGISLVPSAYRPKVSTKADGTLDLEDVRDNISTLNYMLKQGKLQNLMSKAGFYDKGFAFVLTAVRNAYIDLKKTESMQKKQAASYDAYTDPDYAANLTDPRMVGIKKDLGGKADTSLDLRTVGTKDSGNDPGHNSITRFVNALKVDIDGRGDAGLDASEYADMAKAIGGQLLNFVETTFGEKKPYIADLFKAKLNGDPNSLNDITDPKYVDMYPNAYAAFNGKPRNYPQVYFRNAYKQTIKPEADRIQKAYIDQMELDMNPMPANDEWKEKSGGDEEKLAYQDFANPTSMTKRVNKITGKPERFQDDDEFYQSLEETEGNGDGKMKLAATFSSALDAFFLND